MTKSKAWLGNVFVLAFIGLWLGVSAYLDQFQYALAPVLPPRLWYVDGSFEPNSLLLDPAIPAGVGLGNSLYGPVAERDLPWHSDPPQDFSDTRLRHAAHSFINAFRTTLTNPLLDEKHNIALAADFLAGTVLEPGEVFSFNQVIGPRTKGRGFGKGPLYTNGQVIPTTGGGVCKVATTLFNLAIQSDLHLIERHSHSMPTPYVPPGRDATVLWGVKDLRFLNDKGHPLVFWADLVGDTLYIALYGQYDPPLVEWQQEVLNQVPTWTVRRRNPSLAAGEESSIPGIPGMTVRTWVEVEYPGGEKTRRELGVHSYRPLPHYVEYGPEK